MLELLRHATYLISRTVKNLVMCANGLSEVTAAMAIMTAAGGVETIFRISFLLIFLINFRILITIDIRIYVT